MVCRLYGSYFWLKLLVALAVISAAHPAFADKDDTTVYVQVTGILKEVESPEGGYYIEVREPKRVAMADSRRIFWQISLGTREAALQTLAAKLVGKKVRASGRLDDFNARMTKKKGGGVQMSKTLLLTIHELKLAKPASDD